MRAMALLFALISTCSPALADGKFLTIHPDGHRETWTVKPEASQVSPGTVILDWITSNGDSDPNNYVDNGDGTTRREPVVAPELQPTINVAAFKTAIFGDPDLPPVAKVNLILFFPLIDQYAGQPVQMIGAWTAIKEASFAWLTQPVIDKVEAYAAATNVTLVAP